MKTEIDPAWVEKRVRHIVGLKSGEEAAEAEAALYRTLLYGIADGRVQSPGNCAAIALRTQKLAFHQPKE